MYAAVGKVKAKNVIEVYNCKTNLAVCCQSETLQFNVRNM